jgi:hypothetical protein
MQAKQAAAVAAHPIPVEGRVVAVEDRQNEIRGIMITVHELGKCFVISRHAACFRTSVNQKSNQEIR